MTLHLHSYKSVSREAVYDGHKPVHVPAGWQIATGDADDIRVCAAHWWQCQFLVFANGVAYWTQEGGGAGTYATLSDGKVTFCLTR
jgi:hypothetical protein